MRFMILRKSDRFTEADLLPGAEALEAMGRYRDELRAAGVLIAGDGLRSSAAGSARLHSANGSISVVDGPFAEAKELIAGFLLLEVASREEAIHWARRCPSLQVPGEAVIEVRQVVEAADFPAELAPQLHRMPWDTVAGQVAAAAVCEKIRLEAV